LRLRERVAQDRESQSGEDALPSDQPQGLQRPRRACLSSSSCTLSNAVRDAAGQADADRLGERLVEIGGAKLRAYLFVATLG